MTLVGRSKFDHPSLSTAGGSALHAAIESIYTSISDHLGGRYKAYSPQLNNVTVTYEHNFGVALSELSVLVYTGSHPNLTRVSDLAAAGWTIVANSTDPKTQIDITTPSSGGPHTFAVFVVHGRVITPGSILAADIAAGAIENSKIASGANIARSKLASGTPNHVVIHDGSGVLSSEAALSKSRGGTGADSSNVTFPSSGTLVTQDGSETLLNKTTVSSTGASTGGFRLPTGNSTTERPTGTAATLKGMVRYNDTDDVFEGYNELSGWSSIGGGGTTDRVTQASHGFVLGDVLYMNGSTYAKAKADAANTAEVVGMVSRVIDTSTFEITLSGEVTGLSGLTSGLVYFLSPSSPGATTSTEPSVVGQVSLPIGVASSNTSMYVQPKRGILIGATNVRTQIALANNATTTVQDVSAYEAGQLEGYVSISATTSLKFYVEAQFSRNGAGTNYNVSYQTSGDTPPAGFLVQITAAGLLQVVMPSVTGFTSSAINYGLNVAAVGATLPLSINPSIITVVDTSSEYSANTKLGLMQYINLPSSAPTYSGGVSPTVTSTQAGFAVVRSIFIPYQVADSTWRCRFSIAANFTSAATTGQTITVTGLTDRLKSGFVQCCSAAYGTAALAPKVVAVNGSGIVVSNSSVTADAVFVNGDIELNSKPSWAY